MPLILPGNVATATASTAYDIANSCRFNKADTPGLSRSTGDGNEKIGSFSFWWKTADPHDGSIFYQVRIDSSNFFNIGMDGGGNIEVTNKDSGSYNLQCETTAIYRDHSAWYHVCAIVDTTQAVAANRMKLYINGIQVTSFQTETYPDQNDDLKMNSNSTTAYISHSGNCVHGYLAEFVAIDGTAQAVTDFGEFDEDSPTIWKPKDVSELTKGVNGFYLDFEDSSALGNCAFGGTDFTVSNLAAVDQCVDSPTNNFATLNPLFGLRGSTLTEGNLKVSAETDNNFDIATFGSDMKWYYEWKVDDNYDGSGGGIRLGAIHIDELGDKSDIDFGSGFGRTTTKLYTNSNDGKTQEGGGNDETTGLTRATTNNIIMCACDGAGAKIWWGVNGTWLDYGSGAGDPAAGSNAAPWASNAMAAGIYFPITAYSGTAAGGQLNLGNPSYANSSDANDANGYGKFEYAPPSGFYALCTKNLGAYGG